MFDRLRRILRVLFSIRAWSKTVILRQRHLFFSFLVFLNVLWFGACATPTPQAPTWETMTRQQRLEWMGVEVFPKMKALFQEHDPVRYKDFSCDTCHGKNYQSVDYKMPHTIFPMSQTSVITDKDSDPKLAAAAKFMNEKVLPEMRKLLGKPLMYCFNCHETK